MIHLAEKYQKEVVPEMMKNFGYDHRIAVPRIEKIVVNIGFGSLVAGKGSNEKKKVIKSVTEALSLITGQKPIITKARRSISSFKLRKGDPVGAMVTLRRKRMYDFLERLIHIVLPRSRDFLGINPDSFDKAGNLTIAIKEHISFLEIMPEKTQKIFSLEITVVTTAESKEEGLKLLRYMGFPIKK